MATRNNPYKLSCNAQLSLGKSVCEVVKQSSASTGMQQAALGTGMHKHNGGTSG